PAGPTTLRSRSPMRAERPSRRVRPSLRRAVGTCGRSARFAAMLAAAVAVVAALLAGCGPSAGTGGGGGAGAAAAVDAGGHPDVPGVPEAAWRTLTLIDAGQRPEAAEAPGTKGGQRFGNREKRLPQRDGGGDRVR